MTVLWVCGLSFPSLDNDPGIASHKAFWTRGECCDFLIEVAKIPEKTPQTVVRAAGHDFGNPSSGHDFEEHIRDFEEYAGGTYLWLKFATGYAYIQSMVIPGEQPGFRFPLVDPLEQAARDTYDQKAREFGLVPWEQADPKVQQCFLAIAQAVQVKVKLGDGDGETAAMTWAEAEETIAAAIKEAGITLYPNGAKE